MNNITRFTATPAYRQTSPRFFLIWIGFVAICAASAFMPLFRILVPQTSLHPMYMFTPMIWLLAGVFMITLGATAIGKGEGTRGVQNRWGIIMGLWAPLFTITYILSPSDYAEVNPMMWFVVLPVVWVLFASAAIIWEITTVKKQERQIQG